MRFKQLRNLICAGMLGSSILFCGVSEAGVVTDRLPLQCYADHQVNTYNSPGAAKRAGYISANVDLIKITQVRGDGWCYGSYPGAGGKRVSRWFRITDVCADAGYTNRSANVRGKQTVYRTRSGGATLGSVSNNEGVIVVADNGSRAQIVYRLDNGTGYKLGWVPSSSVQAPAPVQQSHNPQGYFDGVVSNNSNQIRVTGWAFDRDNVNEQIRVHVYVGGPAGSGEGHEIRANKHRPDVGRAFSGVGDYHGFDDNITVNRTGNQEVYVYGINIGGGSNVEIGHKSVNIKNSVQQPATQKKKALRTVDAYSYSSLQSKIGRVDAGDMVTILQESGNAYRVSYPTARGAKIGWVTKDIFKKDIVPAGLLYPLKGKSVSRSSLVKTNGQYCDYQTGGSIPLYAPTDGWVEFRQSYAVNHGKLASYGNNIVFTSMDGKYWILFAHLSSFNNVTLKYKETLLYPCYSASYDGYTMKNGKKVNCYKCSTISLGRRVAKKGDLLGYTGMTGNASAHHVHIEIKENGRPVNPQDVFTTW